MVNVRSVQELLVDLDATPFVPDGWTVESHTKGGSFVWDKKVRLHREPEQVPGKSLKGTTLQKRLKGKGAYNANLLDWLLAHPDQIPEEWKQDEKGNTVYVYFFETVYRSSGGSLCVRCLFWHGSRWVWRGSYLEFEWSSQCTAVLRAS